MVTGVQFGNAKLFVDPNLQNSGVGGAGGNGNVPAGIGANVKNDPPPDGTGGSDNKDGLPAPTVFTSIDASTFSAFSSSPKTPILPENASLSQLRDAMAVIFMQLRTSDLQTRDKELEAGVATRLAAVEKGVEAAKTERDAAQAAAWGQIAGGIVQFGFSAAGGVAAFKNVPKTGLDAGGVQKLGFWQRIDPQVLTTTGQGLSSISSGAGGVVQADKNYEAAQKKAEQQRGDIAGETSQTRSQQANERATQNRDAFLAFLQAEAQQEQMKTDVAKRTFG